MPRKVKRAEQMDTLTQTTVEIDIRDALATLPTRRRAKQATTPKAEPAPPRIPRITRLMALAIKFQDMIDRGEIRDYAEIARLGHVTRARMTQIMNLLLLAPDIQELLLDPGRCSAAKEREIRRMSREADWSLQRRELEKSGLVPHGAAVHNGR